MLPVFHYFIGLIKYYNIFYCDFMHQPSHQRTPRHQRTHPQRKPLTIPPSPTQKCGSRTPSSSAKKNKKAKNDPGLTCWVGLLADIERVTGKVERLCLDANRVHTCRLKAQSKNIQKKLTNKKDLAPLSAHMHAQPHHQPQQKQPHEQAQAQPQPKNCNPDCHYLMYECMKLSSANQKLQQEKEHLEKRLYYQSKEKRELRWKLEKDHDRQRDRDTDDIANLTNYFTMYYSDSHANSAQSSHSITVHPPAPGPLKQKNPNTPSMGNSLPSWPSCPQRVSIQKQNMVPLPEQQSLLIELTSGREEREKEGKYGKSLELRRAHFEAHLQDLLELCRNEHDQGRKRAIREQMRKVVDQLQTLKPE